MKKNGKVASGGFSLVELSVVLIILGLLVGGILAGRNLIHAAEINGTMADMERYVTAYQTFRMKYGCIPGDCHNAEDYFPSVNPPIENGDGSGLINCESGGSPECDAPTNEHVMAVRSLHRAGLISGATIVRDEFIKAKLGDCHCNITAKACTAARKGTYCGSIVPLLPRRGTTTA